MDLKTKVLSISLYGGVNKTSSVEYVIVDMADMSTNLRFYIVTLSRTLYYSFFVRCSSERLYPTTFTQLNSVDVHFAKIFCRFYMKFLINFLC
jgi:hypothetical protein